MQSGRKKIINPETGRQILVDGPTFDNLIRSGYVFKNGQLIRENKPGINPLINRMDQAYANLFQPQVQQQPIFVQGPAPTVDDLIAKLREVYISEDERKRQITCNLCREYYMKRNIPFTENELLNLSNLSDHCRLCGELCEKRKTLDPLFTDNCQPYHNATYSATRQRDRIATPGARAKAIQDAIRRGEDFSTLLPAAGNQPLVNRPAARK